MREAQEYDIDEIISYLENNVQDCLYMYIDIKKYRLNNPAMKVWFNRDQNNRINLVIMKYHTSISLHMEGDTVSLSEISRIIHEYNPASITGKKSIIEKSHLLYVLNIIQSMGIFLSTKNFVILAEMKWLKRRQKKMQWRLQD